MSCLSELNLGPVTPPSVSFSSCLHPGARFVGSQLSKGKKYNVEAVIQVRVPSRHHLFLSQTTNLPEKTFYGLLTIEHLAEEVPNSTTFFEAEIISRKFPFTTGKWDATVEIDRSHWNELNVPSKFPNYYKDSFDYSALETADHVFMRWKEKFLVPDTTNSSASEHISFSGFYYICLRKTTGVLTGYYYQGTSERYFLVLGPFLSPCFLPCSFQLLELNYVPQTTFSSFQII
ncbi:unnamed protein product [Schistocephalus solidus]|uniref:Glucose-induced degradation protein 4 homolog n=1 Tax=Schistocephalus solidus TaxID=70667 RepID=A0A183SSJ5_SCHSO|nr:unnamed protein product [Schistocephalus solidus]